MIRFIHVSKEYARGGLALDDVSFHVAKGEFAFLTGPSGAGKSTILKLVYMEELPTEGDVRVAGVHSGSVRRAEIAQLRRKLGVVFQDFRLLEERTAEQNIAFALEVTDAPRASIATKVSRLLTQVGLSSKANALPRELSGGEQQRVAIARALVNDPVLILADEPTGALDTRTSFEVMGLLQDLNRGGMTVVLVTHEHDIADFASRVVTFRDGRVVDDRRITPVDAYARRREIESELPERAPA